MYFSSFDKQLQQRRALYFVAFHVWHWNLSDCDNDTFFLSVYFTLLYLDLSYCLILRSQFEDSTSKQSTQMT